jgi:hypothetical protein
MDFDNEMNCGAETGSLRIIKHVHQDYPVELEIEEVTHECEYPEGHDGEHRCLNCGISWIPEVPC